MKPFSCLLVFIGAAAVIFLITKGFGIPKKLPALQNYEEAEYAGPAGFIQPASIVDGLAVYAVGSGPPVLLLPYPHAHTVEPMAQGSIAKALVEIGKTVITFDVPGAYRSTRPPVGDITEMIDCAEQALNQMGINGPVDVVGHSMGGLAALAFAIERPQRTSSLLLIGSMSGFPSVLKQGLPGSAWKLWQAEYWKFILLGLKVKSGYASLTDHKQLFNTMSSESYHNKDLFDPIPITPDDQDQGIPIREILWGGSMFRKLDYANRLANIQVPTLILVGRHDPEAPPVCSEELHQGISGSRLVVFENSGHYPYIEEREDFIETVADFYGENNSTD